MFLSSTRIPWYGYSFLLILNTILTSLYGVQALNEDFKRELLDGFEDLLREQLSDYNYKITQMNSTLGMLKDEINMQSDNLAQMTSKLSSLGDTVNSMESANAMQNANIDSRMTKMNKTLENVNEKVNSIDIRIEGIKGCSTDDLVYEMNSTTEVMENEDSTGMTTQTTPNTASPIVTPPTAPPQCKCGQQQGNRKKRSNNLPLWPLNSKKEGNTQNTTGNQTEKRGGAEINEFPWMVLITYVGRELSTCGGSIINNKYIITAGHCLLSPVPPNLPMDSSDLNIYLGEHDLSTSTETTETIQVKAGRIIVHEEFDSVTLFNDIGLIELQEPLNLESTIYIAPACPPDQNDLYEDREAVVTGWGFIKSPSISGPSSANILKKAVVKIYNNNDCQVKYTMATEQVTENMLCALGSSNEDACVNDSGGPLVVKEGGSWVVVGLVSWGPSDGSCGGTDGKPGVYTRVGKYLDWIGSKINKASTCPPVATPRNSLRNSFGIY